jgi:hypothetical protein
MVTSPKLIIPTFDAEQHRYYVGDRELPAVNRLLRQGGFVDESYFYEEVRRRGTFTHEATRLYDLDDLAGVHRYGRLDVQLAEIAKSVDVGYVGSVQSYVRWVDTVKPDWFDDGIEVPLAHPVLGYAGKPDRWGLIQREPWHVEIKRGQPSPWHQIQVAGYIPLRKPPRRKIWRRGILYLNTNGSIARLVPVDRKPYNPVEADRMFRNCLDSFHWRLKHGDRSCFADRTDGNYIADFGVAVERDDDYA